MCGETRPSSPSHCPRAASCTRPIPSAPVQFQSPGWGAWGARPITYQWQGGAWGSIPVYASSTGHPGVHNSPLPPTAPRMRGKEVGAGLREGLSRLPEWRRLPRPRWRVPLPPGLHGHPLRERCVPGQPSAHTAPAAGVPRAGACHGSEGGHPRLCSPSSLASGRGCGLWSGWSLLCGQLAALPLPFILVLGDLCRLTCSPGAVWLPLLPCALCPCWLSPPS